MFVSVRIQQSSNSISISNSNERHKTGSRESAGPSSFVTVQDFFCFDFWLTSALLIAQIKAGACNGMRRTRGGA